MKIRHSTAAGRDGIELQMTPMIDVVFQLLVFFIFTFKIIPQEGDFHIKMPSAALQERLPDDYELPPMKVRLQSDSEGELAGIALNDTRFGGFQELRDYIIGLLGDDRGPGSAQESAEVELDCDYNLRYEYVMSAITAVSGYRDASGAIVPLVEKIKFTQPRPPGGG